MCETNGDHFQFDKSWPIAFSEVVVFGGPGDDALLVDDSVTLPTILFGGAGNNFLKGGSGPNVLVGGPGANVLVGGAGRNVLIGGPGPAVLVGGCGGNVLIGGSTNYDSNVAALSAILAEWGRTDADYLTRLHHLDGSLGGGLNGSAVLNVNTVHDNGAVDVLTGGDGLDWFFASASGRDVLLRRRRDEVVTLIQ